MTFITFLYCFLAFFDAFSFLYLVVLSTCMELVPFSFFTTVLLGAYQPCCMFSICFRDNYCSWYKLLTPLDYTSSHSGDRQCRKHSWRDVIVFYLVA